MAVLIDSDVFITMERRGMPLGALNSIAPPGDIAMASVGVSELLLGAYRADTAARRAARESFIETLLGALPVLPFDVPAARIHAEALADLTARGQRIGSNDLLIAATALAHGFDVLTQNIRDFERVPGLTVVQPKWQP